jgi:hypothetical protein
MSNDYSIISYMILSTIMIPMGIFKHTAFLLYKNPILFLLPSIGSLISILTEGTFVIGLRNNNNQNYFPFSDVAVLILFFIAFTITYFQLLVIARKVIPKTAFKAKDDGVRVVELLIIYSIYALALVNIGNYENDLRKSFASQSDRLSLYTFKVNNYHEILAIVIPSGIFIILLSAIISLFFTAWMVEYILVGDQVINRHGVYQSLKNIFSVIAAQKDKSKRVGLLFLITIPISIIGFMLTNIAVVSIADRLDTYMFQFVVSGLIGTVYSPFFLIYLFLTLFPRPV